MKKSTKHLFFPVLLHAPLEVRGVYLNSNFPFSFIPMGKFLPTFFCNKTDNEKISDFYG